MSPAEEIVPSPPAPCKPIIHLEKGEALPSLPHSHQGFVHQENSVIHSEEKLHTLMVTRTSGAEQAAGCKIVRPSLVRKTVNTELTLCFQNLKDM